jgi:hypothetical protein
MRGVGHSGASSSAGSAPSVRSRRDAESLVRKRSSASPPGHHRSAVRGDPPARDREQGVVGRLRRTVVAWRRRGTAPPTNPPRGRVLVGTHETPTCRSARAGSAATSSFGVCVRCGSRFASTGVRVRAVVGSIAERSNAHGSGDDGHRGRGQRVPTRTHRVVAPIVPGPRAQGRARGCRGTIHPRYGPMSSNRAKGLRNGRTDRGVRSHRLHR